MKSKNKENNANEMKAGIRWTSKVNYVDIETGEILNGEINKVKEEYIIIKTKKEYNVNNESKTGTVTYTRECRKGEYKQGKIPYK